MANERMMSLVPSSLDEVGALAKRLSGSKLLPAELRASADIAVTILQGLELGLKPMQALRSIHIVKGKPVLSAELIAALVMRSSECTYFRLVSSTDAEATYETLRRDFPEPVRLSFTMEQAKAAGLVSRDNWKKYPAAMLRARCKAALAREVYPEYAMGLYDADELPPSEPLPTGVVDAEIVDYGNGPMKTKRVAGTLPTATPYHHGSRERTKDHFADANQQPPEWAGGPLPQCADCGARLASETSPCESCGVFPEDGGETDG